MTTNIKENLFNDLSAKNDENKGLTTNVVEAGFSMRSQRLRGSGERSVSAEPKPIEEFYELFDYVLQKADEYDGTEYGLRLIEEMPTESTSTEDKLPVLTVRLLNKNPTDRELKPRLVESYVDPDHPGDMVQIFRRAQSCKIEMTVCTRTNKAANVLANWVEDKFFEYLWIFIWRGFHKCIFLGREEDRTESIKGQLVHKRALRFSVETCRITKTRESRLRKIQLDFSIDKKDSTDLLERS